MHFDKTYRLKLYPNKAQASRMARSAGACRWLWNHFLELQQKQYVATGKFIFRFDMDKMLPSLKKQHEWLKEPPSASLQRVCRNLDAALKGKFKQGKGFPRFRKRGVSREAFYVTNEQLRLVGNAVNLPKIGRVKFRSGRLPEGRIMSGTVSFDGRNWWCTVQCQVPAEGLQVEPAAKTVIGVDLGLAALMVRSDGVAVRTPKHLRTAQRRLRRAQRVLARRLKGSANRRKQAALVARLHARVACRRRDTQHKATSMLVASASAVVTEDLNVKGMARNRRLALSISDAGWGETLRQIAYKCQWAGKAHLKAGRFEPSTQTCSACRARKTGSGKLRLHQRTYRCASCGHELDRDLNAALNLRRIGLVMLEMPEPVPATNIDQVGQAMPEPADDPSAYACGEPASGPAAIAVGRYGSPKQESSKVKLQ